MNGQFKEGFWSEDPAGGRYFGTAVVAGVLIIPINVVILAPGALTVFPNQG